MTHALNRFSAALTGWIPDISGIPPRRQIVVAGVASLLINLLAIILVALIFDRPPKPPPPFAKPKLRMRGIELVVVPPEPEPEPMMPFTLQQKPEMPFMDSRGLDIAREAALNPIFQADENMRAASELPATGDAPLPSQAGGDRPFNAFKTQRSLLGSSVPAPFPPAEATPPLAAIPPVAPAPPVDVPEPTAAPEPPEPPPAAEKIAEKAEPAPPAPTPPIEPKKTAARPDDIAMTSKVPTAITKMERAPATPMPAKPTPALRPMEEPQQMAKLTTPAPQPQMRRESGYQPEQEMNRIEGNITNFGKKSVDAMATPMAKYRKQVNDAIGSRWYYYVRDPKHMQVISAGSAKVSFFIDAEGQVGGITLESNSSNASFAEICTSAVRDAREQIKELKLPDDATTPLKDGRLEYSLTFTFYNL
jgi:hypothetical protein